MIIIIIIIITFHIWSTCAEVFQVRPDLGYKPRQNHQPPDDAREQTQQQQQQQQQQQDSTL